MILHAWLQDSLVSDFIESASSSSIVLSVFAVRSVQKLMGLTRSQVLADSEKSNTFKSRSFRKRKTKTTVSPTADFKGAIEPTNFAYFQETTICIPLWRHCLTDIFPTP